MISALIVAAIIVLEYAMCLASGEGVRLRHAGDGGDNKILWPADVYFILTAEEHQ